MAAVNRNPSVARPPHGGRPAGPSGYPPPQPPSPPVPSMSVQGMGQAVGNAPAPTPTLLEELGNALDAELSVVADLIARLSAHNRQVRGESPVDMPPESKEDSGPIPQSVRMWNRITYLCYLRDRLSQEVGIASTI